VDCRWAVFEVVNNRAVSATNMVNVEAKVRLFIVSPRRLRLVTVLRVGPGSQSHY
jgi:hypothetical protein